MKRKIVYVRWLDAWNRNGWNPQKEAEETDVGYGCEHVGFLMSDDKHSIRLSAGISDQNSTCTETMTIPKGMIKKKVLLGYSEEFEC